MVPHILLSSSNGSGSGTVLGSEIPQRTCGCSEHGTEGNGAETHIIQIVDEPRQIITLQTWNSILVFVPAEEVGELVVKIG